MPERPSDDRHSLHPSAAQRRTRKHVAVTASLLLAVGFGIHCGSSEESLFGDRGPCETVLKAECGKACSDDSQCANGVYCGTDDKCTAECAPGSTCVNGVACSPRGRCSSDPPPVFGGDGGPGDADATLGDSCADIDVTLSKAVPTVVLLIDQSSSMNADFPPGSGTSRWDVLRSALIDPDGGLVKTLEKDVSFGVSLYSYNAGSSPQCPELTGVAWKISNYNDIYDTYADAEVIDNTPTAESIMGVIGFDDAGVLRDGGLARATTPGPKILVLATDGNPDTCANTTSSPAARAFTVWAAQRTFDAGIPTFVVSVGLDIDEGHQQEVANAGRGQPPDAGDASTIYRTTNRQQLVTALNDIILGVRSCKFTLKGSVVAGTESQGRVVLNGAPLALGDPNGWRLDSPTQIEILGSSCTTVKTSPTAQVSVRFPCGAITDIPK